MTLLEWINAQAIGTVFENKYLLSLLLVIVAGVLGKLILFVFTQYLQKFASKTKNKFDDMIFEHTKKPLLYLLIAYGIKLALLNLGINGAVDKLINSIMAAVFLYTILRGIDIVVETWAITFSKKTKTQIDDVLLPLLHKVTKVLFVIIGLLWVLKIWHVDITPYLAG